ncbi:MAG: S-adenosylmethionine:tRNA ribosyltransferase-isomerase [Ignavibacteria bacterium]|jgi:S-adenosylmethionine:tRNA ribosyltransferase-isomerase|nr:S-adenosylmethionine:tRNA ribosyltransferase-isomerase [Ignavibacteria bacterium]
MLDLTDYDYNLPADNIALQPLENRYDSRLLVFGGSTKIEHSTFRNIANYIPANSILIRNSTKVIPARLILHKQTGGAVELLCIEPILPSNDPQIAMTAMGSCKWECIVGGRNVNVGMELNADFLTANILERYENKAVVEFRWNNNTTFAQTIDAIGKIPLPPYIKRDANEDDKYRYQTVYANIDGSVAAPTAGLHFSQNTFNALKAKNIDIAEVVLHVGPGTFVPIDTSIAEHKMHNEQFFVSRNTIETLANNYAKENGFIVATGTTSLRTLESLYWSGVKLLRKEPLGNIAQNYPYSINADYSSEEAFARLHKYMADNGMDMLNGRTQLFITPGYKIRTINALITNFHLPKSTLLLLVSAFIGIDNCKQVYAEALKENYRFLSYGDSSLLMPI